MSTTTKRYQSLLWMLLSLLLIILVKSAEVRADLYAACDNDSIPSSNSASSLDENKVHKICPPSLPDSEELGQPICGDGTAFSFFYTAPIQQSAKREKVLIEFMGGGACWDSDTCKLQSRQLTFPTAFNNLIGVSCSVAQILLQLSGTNLNLLCDSKFGGVDMTEYHTIIVPYCSQDVHMGDSETKYGNNDEVTYHHGGHNMMSVLNWVYENFPDPSQIALTGCSAGATALPAAYDLLNTRYNKVPRALNINLIMDSPVYLTPEYFLKNAYESWNPWTVVDKMQFEYNEWRNDTQYSNKLIEHVLERSSDLDQWGFLSHKKDDVSLFYLQEMSGESATHTDWYKATMESVTILTNKFDNFDTFFMNDTGHCTFGLHFALEYDGFKEWAGGIFKEQKDLTLEEEDKSQKDKSQKDISQKDISQESNNSSIPIFFMNVIVGYGIIFACVYLY